jgi:hypothetical protein
VFDWVKRLSRTPIHSVPFKALPDKNLIEFLAASISLNSIFAKDSGGF